MFWIFLSSIISTIWTIPLLLLCLIRLFLYHVENQATANLMVKELSKRTFMSSYTIIDEKRELVPHGLIIGRWFIAYILNIPSENGNTKKISIHIITFDPIIKSLLVVCKEESKEQIVKFDNETSDNKTSKSAPVNIKIYRRMFSCSSAYYWYSNTPILINARPTQITVIESIENYYKTHNTTVAFIAGPTGTGKTTIGLLLAQKYKSHLCKSFSLTDIGDTLASLYGTVEPTKDAPLIIILDEIDQNIRDIHTGIHCLDKYPFVKNKSEWCRLFDDLFWQYPYTIIIMTSNTTREALDSIDPAYLRTPRCNLHFVLA
jgi:hypothetical protein